ncbi:DNA topoisomerase I [Candidatus Woesearchaeota archaeon]|nr:MAG: DNA topoisomerase I [Candidatus Woesearchaeota archaeon]
MGYELIITEKPNAAKKIAAALADGKPVKESKGGVPYYKVTHGSRDLVVGCAVGHLFGLAEKSSSGSKGGSGSGAKTGWNYPVFDVVWKPAYEVSKDSAYTRKYLSVLKKLAKDADSFTVATDYDVEGEVIGYNILAHVCKVRDGNRMKFSTLTAQDLRKSYESKSPHIDWGQANAGLTRHVLDWFYGINLSRALTSSVKSVGAFKLLSSGRVQGPALKIIVDREREIRAFKPVPYWQVQLEGALNGSTIVALHEKDKFWDKDEADAVVERASSGSAKVSSVEAKQFKQAPPHPFDLTTLQTEAYRSLRISPKDTLAIAQELYTEGLISYPRTSSQVLPEEIGIKKIVQALAGQEQYSQHCAALLSKSKLKPNNGKKTDPAHPAIYPTGIKASLSGDKMKIYDLIVRRFLATLADPAVRETVTMKITASGEVFVSRGTRTLEKGWHEFYGPHLKMEEQTLPNASEGDAVEPFRIDLLDKETQPPKRFTPASIIRELEKRNLGTKATRAQIVDTLFQRGYVYGQPIEATELGIQTVETLEKYSPMILDEELTRHFEDAMEEIRQGKKTSEEVLEEAKKVLTEILSVFKSNEKELGRELLKANRKAQDEINFIGKCPSCKEGDLVVKRGKFGQFVACTKYPDCKQTYALPKSGLIKGAGKNCPDCGTPMILVIKKRKRPQELCLNPSCPSKKQDADSEKLKQEIENGSNSKCPLCGGELVVRKSVYGSFIGCSNYPKCKYTNLNGNSNK